MASAQVPPSFSAFWYFDEPPDVTLDFDGHTVGVHRQVLEQVPFFQSLTSGRWGVLKLSSAEEPVTLLLLSQMYCDAIQKRIQQDWEMQLALGKYAEHVNAEQYIPSAIAVPKSISEQDVIASMNALVPLVDGSRLMPVFRSLAERLMPFVPEIFEPVGPFSAEPLPRATLPFESDRPSPASLAMPLELEEVEEVEEAEDWASDGLEEKTAPRAPAVMAEASAQDLSVEALGEMIRLPWTASQDVRLLLGTLYWVLGSVEHASHLRYLVSRKDWQHIVYSRAPALPDLLDVLQTHSGLIRMEPTLSAILRQQDLIVAFQLPIPVVEWERVRMHMDRFTAALPPVPEQPLPMPMPPPGAFAFSSHGPEAEYVWHQVQRFRQLPASIPTEYKGGNWVLEWPQVRLTAVRNEGATTPHWIAGKPYYFKAESPVKDPKYLLDGLLEMFFAGRPFRSFLLINTNVILDVPEQDIVFVDRRTNEPVHFNLDRDQVLGTAYMMYTIEFSAPYGPPGRIDFKGRLYRMVVDDIAPKPLEQAESSSFAFSFG